MKKIITGLSLLFLAGACTPMFMKLNGIRNPRPETIESVQQKLVTYNAGYTAYSCIPKDSAAFLGILKDVAGLPSNSIFLPDGSRVRFIDTGYCAGKALNFARKLDRDSTYKLYPSSHFAGLESYLLPVGKKTDFHIQEYDFTVVFYWANFLGRENRNLFKVASELQKSFRGKLNFLFVNMDIQESWNMKIIPSLTVRAQSKE